MLDKGPEHMGVSHMFNHEPSVEGQNMHSSMVQGNTVREQLFKATASRSVLLVHVESNW